MPRICLKTIAAATWRAPLALPSNGEFIVKIRPALRGSFKKCLLALELAALGTIVAGQALAGCGVYAMPTAPRAQWDVPVQETSAFVPAVYRPGAERLIRVASDNGAENAGIVGMWKVSFVSDGTATPAPIPAGVEIDFATVQWNSDGTEIMVSGARPPSTGDVCMGVWRQTGRFTYKLKHVALAWASADTPPPIGPVSPAVFVGPGIIRQVVTLSHSRNSYEGTLTIDQYAADGTTLLEHIGGKVFGERVTVD
jgi:hypothetical protein